MFSAKVMDFDIRTSMFMPTLLWVGDISTEICEWIKIAKEAELPDITHLQIVSSAVTELIYGIQVWRWWPILSYELPLTDAQTQI